jgi:hypothetical protein
VYKSVSLLKLLVGTSSKEFSKSHCQSKPISSH